MIEIRVICPLADADRISQALAAVFTTGPARQYPTRDSERIRLYVTADHRPEPWPTPEQAYALAPTLGSELDWTSRTFEGALPSEGLDREYWLREAALLDRLALHGGSDGLHNDAAEAARRLIELDDADVTGDPRAYVRQQYLRYTHTHTRTESE